MWIVTVDQMHDSIGMRSHTNTYFSAALAMSSALFFLSSSAGDSFASSSGFFLMSAVDWLLPVGSMRSNDPDDLSEWLPPRSKSCRTIQQCHSHIRDGTKNRYALSLTNMFVNFKFCRSLPAQCYFCS